MGSSDRSLTGRRDKPRNGKTTEGEGGPEHMPSFKPISRKPLDSEGPEVWRKHYTILEAQLRLWYKQKSSLEAPEQTARKWDTIFPYVKNLMATSLKLFFIDTSYFMKHELDVRLWKYGIYQFIGLLRCLPSDSKLKEEARLACLDILQKGIIHFKEMLINVPKILKLELEPVFSRSNFLRRSSSDATSQSEDLVYRLFISLGDLYRYSFEMKKLPREGKLARDMYIAARFCDPEKARAYNQLGVILKAQNDIVGTIYNYTRAWSAPNPADGSREQLLSVFDEIYKKFNKIRQGYWYTLSKNLEEDLTRNRSGKYELWLHPSLKFPIPSAPTTPPSRRQFFTSVTFKDVMNQFSLAFAHFIGMLFTKIGTELLEDVAKEVTVCFEGLMMTSSSIKLSFLMEVLGLLLFMTDYLIPPSECTDQGIKTQIKYMRGEAVKMTLNLLTILLEKMHQIVNQLDWNNPMLTNCAAALHLWCRWARRKPYICSELVQQRRLLKRSPRKMETEQNESMSTFLVSLHRVHMCLTTLLKRHANILFPRINQGSSKECSQPLGLLPEQLILEKFGDILPSQDFNTGDYFHDGGTAQAKAQLHFRLARVQRFCNKIFGDQAEPFAFYIASDSVVDRLIGNELHLLKFIHESSNEPLRSSDVGVDKNRGFSRRPDCNNARIIIRNKVKENEKRKKFKHGEIKALPPTKTYELWSDLCVRGVKTELLIEPLDVVLDTNCLIRQLDWIKFLIHILPRAIIIPTTVVLELRGLMKGARTGEAAKPSQKDLSLDKQQERMIEIMEIGENCIRALEYLNEHKHFFRVVTMCGREFKMYNYMKQKVFERLDLKARNDEKILETCSQIEARNSKLRNEDSPFRIHRNVLLLTGDRSLRVRAFAQDIPARDIQTFTKWLISVRNSGNLLKPKSHHGNRRQRKP